MAPCRQGVGTCIIVELTSELIELAVLRVYGGGLFPIQILKKMPYRLGPPLRTPLDTMKIDLICTFVQCEISPCLF